MMTIEVAVLLSILSVGFSIFFGLKNNKRSDTKDIEARASERAEINIKLNHIASTTQEIKDQISSLVRDVQKHTEKITKMEADLSRNIDSVVRLHGRIDKVEEALDKKEDKK